jgi:carbohydrate kinase (thermoresistant glucokinase family)
MNMFIIFMGVSGCGKTTIGKMTAEILGVPYYEGDEYHPQENVDKMSSGIPLDDDDREGWLQRLSDLIQEKLAEGESGVLSCSALKKKYRDRLSVDPERVHFVYLKGDYQLIQERMQVRKNHYMPPELLKSQFETLEEPENILTLHIDQPPQTIVEQVLFYIIKIRNKA